MSIIGVRIDGRLIHGQVANLWATKLNISRIMVVDDEVAGNAIEKSGLKLATPAGVKLSVLPVEKAAQNILAGNETRSITKSINVVDQDIDVFKELNAKGVHLIAQMVPSDKAEDFMSLITK